jgi:nitronate monooxygenase
MAGGFTTVELVSAVSDAGALGSLGLAYLGADEIRAAIEGVRRATARPFAVNLFARVEPGTGGNLAAAREALRPLAGELGVEPGESPPAGPDPFPAAFEAVLSARPPVFSFALGELAAEAVGELREREIRVLGTATTVAEAVALEALGVDAVVAQGSEAGGHRGTWLGSFEQGLVGSLALVPQVVDAVGVPVVAAGGIMDGRGIAAALALGAGGVQMGTAFLACPESGTPPAYRDALLRSRGRPTAVTAAFTGRPARMLENRFVAAMRRHDAALAPFPMQSALTGPLREAAAARGDAEYMPLLAGQGAPLARELPAARLLEQLAAETEAALARAASGAF